MRHTCLLNFQRWWCVDADHDIRRDRTAPPVAGDALG
jgi:hypothetical protein